MLVIAVVFVTYGASYSSHSSDQEDRIDLSTTLAHDPDAYLARGAGAIHYAQDDTSAATPAPESAEATQASREGHVLRLLRVVLYPEASLDEFGHPHHGDFILTVESGAVCYKVKALVSVNPTVTVQLNPAFSGQPSIRSGCETANVEGDCYSEDGCVMSRNSTIYLPAGSVVVQTGVVHHWYGNLDPVEAVVYIAAYHGESNEAGCFGGCP